MLSSDPSEPPKERPRAVDKVYKIVLLVVSELHGRVASQVSSDKKPVALRHMPVTLQFCFTHDQCLHKTVAAIQTRLAHIDKLGAQGSKALGPVGLL